MSRSIPVAVFLFSLLLASIGDAAFRIELKDGKEFVTDRYWQEGGQIKFNYYGGVVGVEKDSIGKIEKTNTPVKSADEATTGLDETRSKKKTEEVDIESYREKRA